MKPVIIDFAPGTYEALALYYAKRADLDIRAITVNGIFEGNEQAISRVLAICQGLGIEAPVFGGAEAPIITGRKLIDRYPRALPDSHTDKKAQSGYAWDEIYRQAEKAPGEVEIVCLGPLTNLAIALFKYPDLKQKIGRVVFFGGALDWGNVSQTAEVNLAADPHAAHAVSASGMDVVMLPWSSTRDIGIERENLKLDDYAAQLGELLAERERLPLEDAFVINHAAATMFLADESAFSLKKHIIRIETRSSVCMGRTCPNLMYSLKKDPPNMNVVRSIDKECLI